MRHHSPEPGQLGYAINGKSFPATIALTAKPGPRVLVRMLNIGELLHTMHLHGYHFTIIARDGAPASSPNDIDTLDIAPGESFDTVITVSNLGVWAFHCHVLGHAENANGMFGMVTALIVKA